MTAPLLPLAHASPPVLANLQSTLDEPLLPGKLVIWLLLMLSIIAWVSIVSKALQLAKSRLADIRFLKRLRGSRHPLAPYEEGYEDEASPHCRIYLAGTQEAVWHLLGIKGHCEGLVTRLDSAGTLSDQQARCLRLALESAARKTLAELRAGLPTLRLIGTAALLLGAFGASWSMMTGLSRAGAPEELGTTLATGLGFFVISLFVAIPALVGGLALAIPADRREVELLKFSSDLLRLFERRLGGGASTDAEADASPLEASATSATSAAEDEPAIATGEAARGGYDRAAEPRRVSRDDESGLPPTRVEPDAARAKVYHSGKKQYRSIRDRLLADSDEAGDDAFEMNPIARQAAMQRA